MKPLAEQNRIHLLVRDIWAYIRLWHLIAMHDYESLS
jgi:hypothetical protein